MVLRWCAAGMVEAREQFRRVNGRMHLRKLRAALEAHVAVSQDFAGGSNVIRQGFARQPPLGGRLRAFDLQCTARVAG